MLIQIVRKTYTARTTIGDLYIDGMRICYTLEDTVRAEGIKVKGETAIPAGCYKVGMRFSPKFQRELPLIYTEGETLSNGGISFKYIMLHGGNRHSDSYGCPLVAYKKINDTTIQGTAEKEVTGLIKDAIDKGEEVSIEVINYPQEN